MMCLLERLVKRLSKTVMGIQIHSQRNRRMTQENNPTTPYAVFTLALMEIQRRKGRPITTTQAAPMIKYSIYASLLLLTPHHEGARQTVVVSLL